TAPRCTTGCASTASSTCCRPRSRSGPTSPAAAATRHRSRRRPSASRRPGQRPHKNGDGGGGSAGLGYSACVRLLFIVDPLDRLALAGDSSYALMLEAAGRGWGVWTCQIANLGLVGDDAVCD